MDRFRTNLILAALVAAIALAVVMMIPRAVSDPTPSVGEARPASASSPIARRGRLEREEIAMVREDRGTLLTFRFDVDSRMKLGEQAVDTTLGGRMTVLIVDRRDTETLALVRFPDLRVSYNGQTGGEVAAWCSALARALAAPTALRMDEHGQTLGYRFPVAANGDHRNWIRTLVSAFRFVAGPAGTSRWEAVEGDATGEATTSYVRSHLAEGFQVTRTRTGYVDLPRARPAGQAVAEFGPDLEWPQHARIDEGMVLVIPEADTYAEGHFGGDLQLLSVERVSAPAADWSGPWAAAGGAAEESELAAESLASDWGERVAATDLGQLLASIRSLVGQLPAKDGELFDAIELLAKVIELRPQDIEGLRALVLDPETQPGVLNAVTRALARAGTEPAQDLLSGSALDARLTPDQRIASLDAMFALASPNRTTLERIGEIVAGAAAITQVEAGAMLLMGALAPSSPDGSADLIEFEGRAHQEGIVPLWLQSLGNAGTADVLGAAARYAGAADETVRAAAMVALRKVDSEAAVTVLMDRVQNDASAGVRRRAIEALGESPASVPFEMLASVAMRDADDRVRSSALVAAFRRAPEDPRLQELLARRAAEDPSEGIRSLAQQLLGS